MVARAPWGEPVVTKMVAGIGRLSAPINGSNTIPISFDAVLEQWGIVTVEGKRKVTDTISNEAGRVMKVGHPSSLHAFTFHFSSAIKGFVCWCSVVSTKR
jgi:hypothetical protein